ncbi:putative LRR receptor-like serine/threonine-protein kinase [Hordeum vulgare]|nr:putative LRR receptor-like serine/threonine-protein kinase [Hordeum vulgare]
MNRPHSHLIHPLLLAADSTLLSPDSSPPLLLRRPHSVAAPPPPPTAATCHGSVARFIAPSPSCPTSPRHRTTPPRPVAAPPRRLIAPRHPVASLPCHAAAPHRTMSSRPADAMPPRKTPRDMTRFFGVRAKPSDNFGVEFCDADRRFWLGTYPTVHEAARAYDVAVWRAGRPNKDLNFPKIETQAIAELLVPGGGLSHGGDHDEQRHEEEARNFRRAEEEEVGRGRPLDDDPRRVLEEGLGDSEEEEVCEDPDKGAFWEQLESSDDEE